MCAKPADPAIRTALVETAAHIVATEGLGKLTLRRLAADVGTSTMAIYTHFGGMDELRRAVRREGFARLGGAMEAVDRTDDPVSDYVVLGWAYHHNATTNPDLYRAMFLDGPVDDDDRETGLETFAVCIDAADRCARAGRFAPGDETARAMELWGLLHGLVTLELANLMDTDTVLSTLTSASSNLFAAWGEDPSAFAASLNAAILRMQDEPSPTNAEHPSDSRRRRKNVPPVGIEPTT